MNTESLDDSDDVFYGNGFVASKIMTQPALGDSVSGMISDEE
jgi:hypothetical protein